MKGSTLFNLFVIRSWWAILAILLSLFIFDRAHTKLLQERSVLRDRLEQLQKSIESALVKNEDLQEQIAHQDDPDWIELVLMRKLGLVPEGEKKVVFK